MIYVYNCGTLLVLCGPNELDTLTEPHLMSCHDSEAYLSHSTSWSMSHRAALMLKIRSVPANPFPLRYCLRIDNRVHCTISVYCEGSRTSIHPAIPHIAMALVGTQVAVSKADLRPELEAQGVDFAGLEEELRRLARQLLQAGATQVTCHKPRGHWCSKHALTSSRGMPCLISGFSCQGLHQYLQHLDSAWTNGSC